MTESLNFALPKQCHDQKGHVAEKNFPGKTNL